MRGISPKQEIKREEWPIHLANKIKYHWRPLLSARVAGWWGGEWLVGLAGYAGSAQRGGAVLTRLHPHLPLLPPLQAACTAPSSPTNTSRPTSTRACPRRTGERGRPHVRAAAVRSGACRPSRVIAQHDTAAAPTTACPAPSATPAYHRSVRALHFLCTIRCDREDIQVGAGWGLAGASACRASSCVPARCSPHHHAHTRSPPAPSCACWRRSGPRAKRSAWWRRPSSQRRCATGGCAPWVGRRSGPRCASP